MSMAPRMPATTLASIFAIAVLISIQAWAAPSEKILHSFSGSDGSAPYGGLIFDSAGNLYGTTATGGSHGFGTIFKMSLSGGTWTETVIHNFAGYPTDGDGPESNMVFDSAGNLYGTTLSGGSAGAGTVFELSPSSGSKWTIQALHSFACCSGDGVTPVAGVYLDGSGNIFGTTLWGGTGGGSNGCDGEGKGCGTFFELTKSSSGWKETVLYNFNGAPDAALPYGSLVRDKAGNFYDTSIWGGSQDYAGTVFELTQQSDGTWSDSIVFTDQGFGPNGELGGLVFDSEGNLYGNGESAVYEISPTSGGWNLTTLYNLTGGVQPANPYSGLIFANPTFSMAPPSGEVEADSITVPTRAAARSSKSRRPTASGREVRSGVSATSPMDRTPRPTSSSIAKGICTVRP